MLESCTEKVKQTIQRQYCNVKKWLFEAYQRQVSEIDNIVNMELVKYLQGEDDLKQVTELLTNYALSSSFLLKSKIVLEKVKRVSTELNWSTPTYVAPKEEYMRFSEEFVTEAQCLIGHCVFDSSPDEESNFESFPRRLFRSQSLVEIPTFTKVPEKPPSELLSQKSVSSSMSSIPASFHTSSMHHSTTREELRARDQSISEVYMLYQRYISE